jgi:hypothetical protein
MTADHDDLFDPRFDAAWKAVSREEPPTALDDAIRAAARREAATRPQRTEGKGGIPEALRPERWWWPLAAAATIGAIAIGILQLTPTDHVVAPAADKSVVSDVPAASTPSKPSAAPGPSEKTRTPEPAAEPPPSMPAAGRAPTAAPAPAPAPVAPPAVAPRDLRKDLAAPAGGRERTAADTTAAAAPAPTPSQGASASAADADAAKPAPSFAEPFPAQAKPGAAKPPQGAAAASAPAAQPAAAAEGFASPKLEAQQGAATLAPAPPRAPPAPLPARRVVESNRAGGVSAESRAESAAAKPDARAKTPPKLPPEEWIALIRRLRDEGRSEEAARELAAFREAYADHDRLLPRDLREWQPSPRP